MTVQLIRCLFTLLLHRRASPHFLLPLQVDTLLVSGDVDEDVPCDLVKAFHDSAVAARASEGAGPRIELLSLENCGHINVRRFTRLTYFMFIFLLLVPFV